MYFTLPAKPVHYMWPLPFGGWPHARRRGWGSLQTPGDVIRCLEKKLSPVFAKKNMLFGVEVVDEVS